MIPHKGDFILIKSTDDKCVVHVGGQTDIFIGNRNFVLLCVPLQEIRITHPKGPVEITFYNLSLEIRDTLMMSVINFKVATSIQKLCMYIEMVAFAELMNHRGCFTEFLEKNHTVQKKKRFYLAVECHP